MSYGPSGLYLCEKGFKNRHARRFARRLARGACSAFPSSRMSASAAALRAHLGISSPCISPALRVSRRDLQKGDVGAFRAHIRTASRPARSRTPAERAAFLASEVRRVALWGSADMANIGISISAASFRRWEGAFPLPTSVQSLRCSLSSTHTTGFCGEAKNKNVSGAGLPPNSPRGLNSEWF
jgi:hypothetical protein